MNIKARVALLAAVTTIGSFTLLAPPAQALTARTVSIEATPQVDFKGTKVTFEGVLTNSPKGSLVKVQRRAQTSNTWITVKNVLTSDNAGNWSVLAHRPAVAGYFRYRAYAPATATLKAATSPGVWVTSLRRTLFKPFEDTDNEFELKITQSDHGEDPEPIYEGGESAAYGSLTNIPGLPNAGGGFKVTLQYRADANAAWTNLGTTLTLQPNAAFRIDFDNAQDGQYRLITARKGLNAAGVSEVRDFDFPTEAP